MKEIRRKTIVLLATGAIAIAFTPHIVEQGAIAPQKLWNDPTTKEEECDDEGHSIHCPHGYSRTLIEAIG